MSTNDATAVAVYGDGVLNERKQYREKGGRSSSKMEWRAYLRAQVIKQECKVRLFAGRRAATRGRVVPRNNLQMN